MKKRKIEISEDVYEFLEQVSQKRNESFDVILRNYISNPELSNVVYQDVYGKSNIMLSKLPFSLRIFIIGMIPDNEVKYYVRETGVIKSFQKLRDISVREYIQELFGFFREDRTRKVYLIFRRIGIKTDVDLQRRFRILPQKSTLLSCRIHGGFLNESEEQVIKCLPPGMNGIHQGLRTVTFVLLKTFRVETLIAIIEKCRFLDRVRISEVDFSSTNETGQVKMIEALSKKKSVSIIRCRGIFPKLASKLLSGKHLVKVALGGCAIPFLTFDPSHVNKRMKYIFLQHNHVKPVMSEISFPSLRVCNVSNTKISYMNLIQLLKHKNMRKICAISLRLNYREANSQLLDDDRYDPQLYQLQHLSLSSTKLDPILCQVIEKYCKNLTVLIVSKCKLKDENVGMLKIREMKNLRQLNIGWNEIGETTLKTISEHPSMKKLVTPQANMTASFVRQVLAMKNIQELSFRSKNRVDFTPEFLNLLEEGNLKYLNVIHYHTLSLHQIDSIKENCTKLETFKYSYPDIKDRVTWNRPELGKWYI